MIADDCKFLDEFIARDGDNKLVVCFFAESAEALEFPIF